MKVRHYLDAKPVSPSHSHPFEHEIFILSGQGIAKGEQGEIPIAKESVVFIPPDEHHCLVNSGDEPLRFICIIPIVT